MITYQDMDNVIISDDKYRVIFQTGGLNYNDYFNAIIVPVSIVKGGNTLSNEHTLKNYI